MTYKIWITLIYYPYVDWITPWERVGYITVTGPEYLLLAIGPRSRIILVTPTRIYAFFLSRSLARKLIANVNITVETDV